MTKLHPHPDTFVRRHIGPSSAEIASMLEYLGFKNLSDFSNSIVPDAIREQSSLNIPNALSEPEAISKLNSLASGNKVFKNYLGHGYYGTITPGVIKRNVLKIQDGIRNIPHTKLKSLKEG